MAALIQCYSTGDTQSVRFTLSAHQIPATEKGQVLRNSPHGKFRRHWTLKLLYNFYEGKQSLH